MTDPNAPKRTRTTRPKLDVLLEQLAGMSPDYLDKLGAALLACAPKSAAILAEALQAKGRPV